MRKFIFNRWTTIFMLLLALLLVCAGDLGGAKIYAVLAAVFWLVAGCPKLFRLNWQREPMAKITASAPLGRREEGLDGCFGRIDPKLRDWLAENAKEGATHDS